MCTGSGETPLTGESACPTICSGQVGQALPPVNPSEARADGSAAFGAGEAGLEPLFPEAPPLLGRIRGARLQQVAMVGAFIGQFAQQSGRQRRQTPETLHSS